jgi:hypothetical protein
MKIFFFFLSEFKLPLLKELNLSNNHITCEGYRYISKAYLSRLEKLYLKNNKIEYLKNYYFISDLNFPSLKELYLNNNMLDNDFGFLISKDTFLFLKKLEIKNNDIGIEYNIDHEIDLDNSYDEKIIKNNVQFFKSLSKSDNYKSLPLANFPMLEELNFERNRLGIKAYVYFFKSLMPNLKILNLAHNFIVKKAVKYLSQGNFPNLKKLNLENNLIKNEGVKYLFESNFPNLEEINLSYNLFDKEGVRYFIQGKFPKLRYISLHNHVRNEKNINL